MEEILKSVYYTIFYVSATERQIIQLESHISFFTKTQSMVSETCLYCFSSQNSVIMLKFYVIAFDMVMFLSIKHIHLDCVMIFE